MSCRSRYRAWIVACILLTGSSAAAKDPVLRAAQAKGGDAAHIADRTPAAFVLTSPQGVKVFLDVTVLPDDLAAAMNDPANLFLTTHDHPDHLNVKLVERFPGKKLRGGQAVKQPGSVFWTAESGDVKVQAIASSHQDDQLDGTTNTILVVDVGGVRVVHMGDCGQTELTPEQRKIIGHPDVMIQLLEDPLNSEADVVNQKAYKLVNQAAPAVLIPTHITSVPAVKLLEGSYGYALDVAPKNELALTPALLHGKRRAILMGVNLDIAAKAGLKASGEL